MKYLFLVAGNEKGWAAEEQPDYSRIRAWYDEQVRSGRLIGGHELAGSHTATTLRRTDDGIQIVDGPFAETKEAIGGFMVVDVPDLDAAIALARTWPGLQERCSSLERTEAIEIRPVGQAGRD